MMSKYKIHCGVVHLLLCIVALSMQGVSAKISKKNIIFVLSDDQRFDALGVMNPELDTPNMDRLATEGVHFKNAFVSTSLCSPSRASILTGLPMRDHKVVDNNSDLSSALDTFPQALQRAGYKTALIGKWHMGGDNAQPRAGFDHWVSFAGQGNYGVKDLLGRPSILNVNGEEVPQKGYITDELTDYAMQWLRSLDSSQPFMLYLSHKAVHAPFSPANRHAAQYHDTVIQDITPTPEQLKNEPMWVQNQRNSWHGAEFAYHSTLSLPKFRKQYRRTLSAVDDSLGRILKWLEQSEQLENTVVIFFSDNGFMFGEHGLIDKRNAYEESIRVPLVIWAPGELRPGQVVTRFATNQDIAPTILGIASAELASPTPGRDLIAMLSSDGKNERRDRLIYEYYWEFNYPQTPTIFAIRDQQFKYIRHHGVWDTDALYDLVSDPKEQKNLIADPAFLDVRLRLQTELHQALSNQKGEHTVPYTYKFNQGAVFRRKDGSGAAEFPTRWFRTDNAPDRLEHVVPDGQDKEHKVKILDKVIRANNSF